MGILNCHHCLFLGRKPLPRGIDITGRLLGSGSAGKGSGSAGQGSDEQDKGKGKGSGSASSSGDGQGSGSAGKGSDQQDKGKGTDLRSQGLALAAGLRLEALDVDDDGAVQVHGIPHIGGFTAGVPNTPGRELN